MLEYVFFQEVQRKRFQDFLSEQGLAWTLEPGDLETLVVVDEAGLDDELAERLESIYDDLFAEEQAQHAEKPPPPVRPDDGSGLTIQLPDGLTVCAQLPPELIARVLTVITAEELAAMVEEIARAVADARGQGRAGA